jgi:hypothetical protein
MGAILAPGAGADGGAAVIEVEIIREYKCCWQVGQRREVSDAFAQALIDGGYARRVEPEAKPAAIKEPT